MCRVFISNLTKVFAHPFLPKHVSEGMRSSHARTLARFAEGAFGIDKARITPPGAESTMKRQVSWLADRRLLLPSRVVPSGRVEEGFPPTVAGAAAIARHSGEHRRVAFPFTPHARDR
jgi:hypothetical protein